jgi:hypothetical protein
MSITNLPNSFVLALAKNDSSSGLSKLAEDKKPSAEAAQSCFLGDLTGFLGKAISGGLSVASAASSLAIPGASLGISKLGEAAASSLLNGLISSTSASAAPAADPALAALDANTNARMMAHQFYQRNQILTSPGLSRIASA